MTGLRTGLDHSILLRCLLRAFQTIKASCLLDAAPSGEQIVSAPGAAWRFL